MAWEEQKRFLKKREKEFKEFLDDHFEGDEDADVRVPKRTEKGKRRER